MLQNQFHVVLLTSSSSEHRLISGGVVIEKVSLVSLMCKCYPNVILVGKAVFTRVLFVYKAFKGSFSSCLSLTGFKS